MENISSWFTYENCDWNFLLVISNGNDEEIKTIIIKFLSAIL
jgi:hypothetical protein